MYCGAGALYNAYRGLLQNGKDRYSVILYHHLPFRTIFFIPVSQAFIVPSTHKTLFKLHELHIILVTRYFQTMSFVDVICINE